MILFLAGLVLAQAPQTVNLGTYSIGGKDVPAVVPADEGPLKGAQAIVLDGEKYLVEPSGRIVRRFRHEGGWSEVRGGYAAAKAAAASEGGEWRVKAFVLPRSDILDLGENVARMRPSTMESSEIAHVSESLARFAAMAEAASGGRLRVLVDLEVDSDTILQTATPTSKPFDAKFLTEYLRPRINGGLYEAEDRVYRGPFDSIFVIHGGFAGPASMAAVSGTAASPIAFYAEGRSQGAYGLSLALFGAWTRHLAFAAAKAGYGIPRSSVATYRAVPGELAQGFVPVLVDPSGVFQGSMWTAVRGRSEASTEDLLKRRTDSPPADWASAADDPFAKLPFLTPDRVGQAAGVTGFEAQANPSGITFSVPEFTAPQDWDSTFSPGREASATMLVPSSKQLTFVDSPFAPLFAKGFPASAQPKLLGWLPVEGRLFLVIQSAAVRSGGPEAKVLEVPGFSWSGAVSQPLTPIRPGSDVAFEIKPDGKTASRVSARGGMLVADAQDADRGDVLSLRTVGVVRAGSALLAGRRGGPALFDAQTHPYLSFFVRSQSAEPMNLTLISAENGQETKVRLFGRWPVPAEGSSDTAKELVLSGEPGWKQAVLDLRKLGVGKVSALYLTSNELAVYWPTRQAAAPTVFLDDLAVSKNTPGPESPLEDPALPEPDVQSPEALGRAFFAASATEANGGAALLIGLLKDPEDVVRLNAARAFQRIKSPEAEAGLGDLVRNLEPRIAEAALEALAFQDTPSAWALVKRAIEIGPFDYTRVFAARAFGKKKDPKSLATLSLMLTSKSWQGRMAGAEAIGAVEPQPLPLVLMAFLMETDPAVRLAATRGAWVADDDVCRRLLWSAVNDPSDEIRAWSCLKLIQSGKPQFANEGLKGVRDESAGMRLRLLELFREAPSEAFRPALRLAVTDSSPVVRAMALRAFATLPGAVEVAEVENTLNDPDPRVKASLVELRKAKGF
jgi:HEAT repeat protein